MAAGVILPRFRYHPEPLETGSVRQSAATCRACGTARGYIYTGPVWAEDDLSEAICPWCIADGSAARRFDAIFVAEELVGGGTWPRVSEQVLEELTRRTPGFIGWQDERWWTHCQDGGQFLGLAGHAELLNRWPQAIADIRKESGYTDKEWGPYFRDLGIDNHCTAYVFRCARCGVLGGYSDCS
jgi:uncharacterized protein